MNKPLRRTPVLIPLFALIALLPLPAASGVRITHARNLVLEEGEGWTRAVLRNPWDTTRILHTYYLVEGGTQRQTWENQSQIPADIPADGNCTVLEVPVSRALVYSSVHCHVFDLLGAKEAVAGLCDAEYNRLPFVVEGLRSGHLVHCGNSQAPSLEAVAALRPQVILYSPYEGAGPGSRLQDLGIPFLACADYMETSPLGRAEWIKLYGRLLGRGPAADSLFAQEVAAYEALKTRAAQAPTRPSLFTGLRYGAVWHMSGGQSTVAQLFADAHMDYLFAYLPRRGATPLGFETVLAKAGEADYWMLTYFRDGGELSYAALEKEYAPYARFRAFARRKIWACNTARCLYYEETAFCPHLLLEDLLRMVHSSVLEDPAQPPRYFFPLPLH